MKGNFKDTKQYSDKGKETYDQMNWDHKKKKEVKNEEPNNSNSSNSLNTGVTISED